MHKKIAVVTGANRGLGLGVSKALAQKGYSVVMVGRDKSKIEKAAKSLASIVPSTILSFHADVTNDTQIKMLASFLKQEFGYIDVLINNAGVLLESENATNTLSQSSFTLSADTVRDTFEINALGALRMCQTLIPLLDRSLAGRIVNVSSQYASLSSMGSGWLAFRVSKTALNAITRILHAELQLMKSVIKINAVCPGWVRTDTGGALATRSIEEGVQSILWAATLPSDGPSGGFFQDGAPLLF